MDSPFLLKKGVKKATFDHFKIGVKSIHNAGSNFYFTLPLHNIAYT